MNGKICMGLDWTKETLDLAYEAWMPGADDYPPDPLGLLQG